VTSTLDLRIQYFELLPVYYNDSTLIIYEYFPSTSESFSQEYSGELAIEVAELPADTFALLNLEGIKNLDNILFTPISIDEYCGSDLSDVNDKTITTPVEFINDTTNGVFKYTITETYNCL